MKLGVFVRGLTGSGAATDPWSDDPALRGRTYAISFERVWSGALGLADGGRRGWTVTDADDQAGVIVAEATTLLFRFVDDVRIRVRLDENAQTRVDMESASRKGPVDLGVNRRRVRDFFRALDRRLEATPAQILDPRAATDAAA